MCRIVLMKTIVVCSKVMTLKWPRFIDLVDFRACVVENVLYLTGGREKSTGKYLRQVRILIKTLVTPYNNNTTNNIKRDLPLAFTM